MAGPSHEGLVLCADEPAKGEAGPGSYLGRGAEGMVPGDQRFEEATWATGEIARAAVPELPVCHHGPGPAIRVVCGAVGAGCA